MRVYTLLGAEIPLYMLIYYLFPSNYFVLDPLVGKILLAFISINAYSGIKYIRKVTDFSMCRTVYKCLFSIRVITQYMNGLKLIGTI